VKAVKFYPQSTHARDFCNIELSLFGLFIADSRSLPSLLSVPAPAGRRQSQNQRGRKAMGTIIKFPTKPRVDNYFGGCPICGGNDKFMNIGRAHWCVCNRHRTKWWIGSNLLWGWREETEAIWQQNSYRLATYREVEPLPCTEEMERARRAESQAPAREPFPDDDVPPF
jgi:hypothetical protein